MNYLIIHNMTFSICFLLHKSHAGASTKENILHHTAAKWSLELASGYTQALVSTKQPYMYYVTLRCVGVTILAPEKQQVQHILSVCL